MKGIRGVLCAVVAYSYFVLVCAKPTDYVYNQETGIGYRIVYQSQTWSKAKELCEQDGGKLAVPKSEADFKYIQSLVRGMYYPNITDTDYKHLVWLGINNLDNYRVWLNVDGENINDTGYHTWAGDNGKGYSDNPKEPHCGGLDSVNPGLRDWWCHRQQPYVCQKNNNITTSE